MADAQLGSSQQDLCSLEPKIIYIWAPCRNERSIKASYAYKVILASILEALPVIFANVMLKLYNSLKGMPIFLIDCEKDNNSNELLIKKKNRDPWVPRQMRSGIQYYSWWYFHPSLNQSCILLSELRERLIHKIVCCVISMLQSLVPTRKLKYDAHHEYPLYRKLKLKQNGKSF